MINVLTSSPLSALVCNNATILSTRHRAKRDVGYNAKMKKAVEPGISMPLSTRHGDGRRLILRTSAPSGATDKNPGVGAYTPRRDTKGNVPMCTEIRAVLWGKPQREKTLEEKIEAGAPDVPGVGAYNPVYTQLSAEAPKLSFSTTPRKMGLSNFGLDTPGPGNAVKIPSLKLPPSATIGRADKELEKVKVFQGKKLLADSLGQDSPGVGHYAQTDRVDYRRTPAADLGRADRWVFDKQYLGGGSNYINDGGVSMKSLRGLGPGAYDISYSTLSPRGGIMFNALRPDLTGGKGAGMPGPGQYTPTTVSVFDKPGVAISGAPPTKNKAEDEPGPGSYLDQSLGSYSKLTARRLDVRFARAGVPKNQYLGAAAGKFGGNRGQDAPGVGKYETIGKSHKAMFEKEAPSWGKSRSHRSKASMQDWVPGPGEYATSRSSIKTGSRAGASFGTAERKMSFIKEACGSPGPMSYTPQKPVLNTPRAFMGSGQRSSQVRKF